jgi:ArsR family transcriptional regulator
LQIIRETIYRSVTFFSAGHYLVVTRKLHLVARYPFWYIFNACFLNSSYFNTLADETRRRLLCLILAEEELCVCELYYALDMIQPKVSRHLGVMREAGVLSVRKEGTWVFYRLHPQLPLWTVRTLELMRQAVEAHPTYRQDAERLSKMADRPAKCCA